MDEDPVDAPSRTSLPAASTAEVAAARLMLVTSRRLRKRVPEWVSTLARANIELPSALERPIRASAADIAAARLKLATSRRLGETAPEWVQRLAAAAPGDVLTP